MSEFTDPLTVTKISSREWRVERQFRYYIGSLGSSEFVDVPQGFITDFASIPRIFWTILPPDGKYTQASVLHDYLYDTKMFDREKCDKIFLESMEVLSVGKLKRYTMYYCVRLFGKFAYERKK